jgi:hypothetical protein
MILCYPGGSFEYENQFPILSEDGTALSSLYYSTTAPSEVEAIKQDRTTLLLASVTGLSSGMQIIVKQDGFITNNVITQVDVTGKRIRIETPLFESGSTFTVAAGKYTYVTQNTIPEGFYRFKNGESILIRQAIQTMTVSYSAVITRDVSLATSINHGTFKNLNAEALNSVYADLCYINNVWNIIDLGQFRELIILKILALAEKETIKHAANYENYLKRVENKVALDTTASVPTSDVEQSLSDSYSLGLGS